MSNIIPEISPEKAQNFRKKMLNWYAKHRRVLPWRTLPEDDTAPDPYKVWLSEIMLQQTTVNAVIPYFVKFTEKWPSVHDLAYAENEEVMENWAGLGYYARARNLHKCAKVVSEDYNGVFPDDEPLLKTLPGIGDYTGAAIRSIAFNKPSTVVDGNVERVFSRYFALEKPLPDVKKDIKTIAATFSKNYEDQPANYAQALMDLGATICTPKSPACVLCPISQDCIGYAQGQAEKYPIKAIKKKVPKRYGYAYIITDGDYIILEKRPEKGLLGGMYGVPTTEWEDNKNTLSHSSEFKRIPDTHNQKIEHVFTHFHLTLEVYITDLTNCSQSFQGIKRIHKNDLKKFGLPTVFKKVINTIN